MCAVSSSSVAMHGCPDRQNLVRRWATRIAHFLRCALALFLTVGGLLFEPRMATASWSPLPEKTTQTSAVVCNAWSQVNSNAFGMGDPSSDSPPYNSEEGFEVLEFDGHLYLGMEADNQLGARLWRTKAGVTIPTSQTDWEEVIADADGKPFGIANIAQNDHIDSLAEFKGYIFASTANQGNSTYGTRIFRSATGDPHTSSPWQDAISAYGDGFGDVSNVNFKDMQVFDGQLCGGTQNWVTGTQVWCTSDGISWSQKNNPGFGAGVSNPANGTIWSGFVYGGALYWGVQNYGADLSDNTSDDIGKLYRAADLDGSPSWVEVYSGAAGSRRVDILGRLEDHLYISVRSASGIVILRSATGEADSWTQVNASGMNGNLANVGAVVDSATHYNGALYVGVFNLSTGFQVWRTAGILQNDNSMVDWAQVGDSGLGDANNLYIQLIPFNGYLYAWTSNYQTGQQVLRSDCPMAKYIILMIADGWGPNHIEATSNYTSSSPPYASWTRYWTTTYASGGSYDTTQAWANFDYVKSGATDSAAAATQLNTGVKTTNGRIAVSADGASRLFSIGDKARALDKAVGAISTVQISNATPAAWIAHNDSRSNGYAIADEGLWGDPNTTGNLQTSTYYGGGHGNTLPAADVLIGGGHPDWNSSNYVNAAILAKLRNENGQTGAFTFVERSAGQDGGVNLIASANTTAVTRLAGLFGGSDGNMDYRLADGSGYNSENPTLSEMTTAALTVLSRNSRGFVLMIEGGAVDWAAHVNNMDRVIGEMIDFDEAAQTVIDWVNDAGNEASWDNTLVIVTGDHETGYLTAGPGIFPDTSLGVVDSTTLALEKTVTSTGRRASWVDTDGDNEIDDGETVYWAWNSGDHTNTLVPLYVKGVGASFFDSYDTQTDTVRGTYLDDTDVFKVMDAVLLNRPATPTALTLTRFSAASPTGGVEVWLLTLGGLAVGSLLASRRLRAPSNCKRNNSDIESVDFWYCQKHESR
jgi:alkaline phosphatase